MEKQTLSNTVLGMQKTKLPKGGGESLKSRRYTSCGVQIGLEIVHIPASQSRKIV